MAAGFDVFSVPLMAYLRFDLPALVSEYQLLAAVKGPAIDADDVIKRMYVDRFEIAPVLLMRILLRS